MRTSLGLALATLVFAAAGGICFGWVGVLGGIVLAAVLSVIAVMLNAFAVLLDCLINPLGPGGGYTFRYPAERPGGEDDEF